MQELQAHLYGMSEVALRKYDARSDLNKIFYKNETTFKFEEYVTKIKMCWRNVVFHSMRIRWWSTY